LSCNGAIIGGIGDGVVDRGQQVAGLQCGQGRGITRMMIIPVTTKRIAARDTISLRLAVLRPGRPRETAVFEGDLDPETVHFGALTTSGDLVGVASVYHRARPSDAPSGVWQVRGMAVDAALQGRGIGAALLDACLGHARETGGALVWCNARIGAVGFYERHGFTVASGEFEIADVGRHVVMVRWL
jgi:ribosomal protein S18 acetylase RimI-like enzyme